MEIIPQSLPDVLLLRPRQHADARGSFAETFRLAELEAAAGRTIRFVQGNRSVSRAVGTVRGLHLQAPPRAQAKLVSCAKGKVLDVAVDARRGSPTFGAHVAVELSERGAESLWVPEGFLHGFATRTPDAVLTYLVTDTYARETEHGVLWSSVGVDWGVGDGATLSDKDAAAPPFAEWSSPFA